MTGPQNEVQLPLRPFLFTMDQLCVVLGMEENAVRKHIHYEGRSIGVPKKNLMTARNIAHKDERPEWRVAENELKRWLRHKGYKFYDRATLRN